MSLITWPADIRIGSFDAGIEYDVQMNVFRDGSIQTYGLPGARWVCSIGFESELEQMQRPRIEALIVDLEGGANRLQMHHHGRPVPNGSMRGSPVLNNAVFKGDKQLSIVSNGTLQRGDIIGLLGQNLMVTSDGSPVGGVVTVTVKPAIRAAANVGTAVVWNKPQLNWIPRTNVAGPFGYRAGKVRPGFQIEFVEIY